MTEAGASRRAVVVGAGVVGVCTALYLQREGFEVTVLDPDPPGEGASQGNAGVIALGAVLPVAMPGTLIKVPGMLLDPLAPLSVRWSYMPRLTPWLMRFVLASLPHRVEEISAALAALSLPALAAYEPLLEGAGAGDLVQRTGLIDIYDSARSFAAARSENDLRRRRGVRLDDMGDAELRQLAPALAHKIRHGVFVPDTAITVNPLRLTQALAADFERRGGRILRERASGFHMASAGVERVVTDRDEHPADIVVVAAGAFSRPLAAQLGSRVPLDTERGYHVMLPEPGVELRLPIQSHDRAFVITPMEHGIRVAGTVELGGLKAPPNYARADVLLRHAKDLLPGLNDAGAVRWMGFRPSLPDSLPVLGRVPGCDNAYLNFGHGHLGLTLAAISGRQIAALAAGRDAEVDMTPYRPDRF
jgi:D-amino-acid dehydrogenase